MIDGNIPMYAKKNWGMINNDTVGIEYVDFTHTLT